MDEAMVTGRMSAEKKAAGAKVLARAGLNASQAVNLMYDRLEREQNADFLVRRIPSASEWQSAAKVIDAIASSVPVPSRFDTMSRGEIKLDRLRSRSVV